MMKKLSLLLLFSVGASGCVSINNTGPANANSALANAAPSSSETNTKDAANGSNAGNSTHSTPDATPHSAETTSVDKDGKKRVTVHFAPGKSEGTYSNSFSGYGEVIYEFGAAKGQRLTTQVVRSDGNSAVLSVIRDGVVIEPGSFQVPDWSGELPGDGTYIIAVGQMRALARRNDKPKNFTLKIKID